MFLQNYYKPYCGCLLEMDWLDEGQTVSKQQSKKHFKTQSETIPLNFISP